MSNVADIILTSNIPWGLYPKKLSIQCKSKKNYGTRKFFSSALIIAFFVVNSSVQLGFFEKSFLLDLSPAW